jgi:hypothetical protein
MLTQTLSTRTFRGQNQFVNKVNILTLLASLLTCSFIWALTHLPMNNPKYAVLSLFVGASLTIIGPLCVLFSKQMIKRCSLVTHCHDIEYPYLYSIQSPQRYMGVIITHIGCSLLLTPLLHSYSCNLNELICGFVALASMISISLQLTQQSPYQFQWTYIIAFGLIISAFALICGFPFQSLAGVYLYMVIAGYHTKTAIECYQLGDPDHAYCLISIPTGSMIALLNLTVALGGTLVYNYNLLLRRLFGPKNHTKSQ